MAVKQVTIGSESYNIAQSTAKQQKTLLSIVGALCAYNAASADVIEIDVEFLRGTLLALGEEKLDKIEALTFYRIFKSGSEHSITIEEFKGNMSGYLTIMAHAIKENLQDFFMLLDEERANARQAVSQIKAG